MDIKLMATKIGPNRWAVSPNGQLGTCGSWPYLWQVQYVHAGNESKAIYLARASRKALSDYYARLELAANNA